MPDLEIHYDPKGEWAALYVDGKLDYDTVGDSYHAEERALALCGVKLVENSPFLRGGNQREHAAPTVADIDEYRQRMAEREQRAAELRAEAQRLMDEANGLDGGSR